MGWLGRLEVLCSCTVGEFAVHSGAPSRTQEIFLQWLRCLATNNARTQSLHWQEVVLITLENGLYLRVQELLNGPKPFPLQSGFNPDTAYRALGMFNPSETSDAYFILSNDRDEVWFICNRHLRTVALVATSSAMRVPLASLGSGASVVPLHPPSAVAQ